MKRSAALVFLLLAGCSTAPVADLLDYFKPGRLEPGLPYYGGVCEPQQAPLPIVVDPMPPAAGSGSIVLPPVSGAPAPVTPGPPVVMPPPPMPPPG